MFYIFDSDLLDASIHNIIPLSCGSFTVPVVRLNVGWSLVVAAVVLTLLMGVTDVQGVIASINSCGKKKNSDH